jgi:hypothetical protein
MRLFLALLLTAAAALAQTPAPKAPDCPPPPPIALQAYEERLNNLAVGINRDGFITGQVVAAAGALQDFQVNVAVQKALDHIEEAQKRAMEKPMASAMIQQTLNGLHQTLGHARDQGSAADLTVLRRQMLRDGRFIQYELFREVDTARRERQQIVMLYTTLTRLDQQLEASMVDSLGSMFESVRSGSSSP